MRDGSDDLVGATVVRLGRQFRRLLPASLRRRLRLSLFRWLQLTWQLRSGVRLRVSSYGDWIVYNEIFVSGEYDAAIRLALDTRSDPTAPFHAVDLGANVGFFTLRVVDHLRQREMSAGEVMITAVEGEPYCVEQLRTRLLAENGLSENVRLLTGLAGERTGHGVLRVADLEHESTASCAARHASAPIAYVDLGPALASTPQIDLLKCDIEGAEMLFLRNYPDLMRKVRVAVFELHHDVCDARECRRLLAAYGFANAAVQREAHDTSIYCVWR